jgi:ABC-2 type transport system permease protein
MFMRTIVFLLEKEFRQIFRNRTMLPVIFLLPLVQMFILVYAATFEMKNINIAIVDKDNSSVSRNMTYKFKSSEFFTLTSISSNNTMADEQIRSGKAHAALVINEDFEHDLLNTGYSDVQIRVDAINGMTASLIYGYCNSVINNYVKELTKEWINVRGAEKFKLIQVDALYWYNPEMNYKIYMLPGILVILVTLVGMFLSAFNLVREKEMGTIEQINVTPIKKYQFITGKLLPFWCIAMFELAFGLTVGKLIFHIPIEGSLFTLFSFAGLYLIVALGFGLFLSAISDTQQQVMFLAFFFMILFVLMSGLFTPVESMPEWAQVVNYLNPLAYFVKVIRMILLKGSGFADLFREFISISIFGAGILSLAVWRYRKTV